MKMCAWIIYVRDEQLGENPRMHCAVSVVRCGMQRCTETQAMKQKRFAENANASQNATFRWTVMRRIA